MKAIEVPDYEDERILVPFTVPRKGGKPLEFQLKRMDFVPEDEFQELVKELDALGSKKQPVLDDNDEPVLDDEGNPVELLSSVADPRKFERDTIFTMLKRFVSARDLMVLQKCSHGQLKFIRDRWQEQSRVTLGEYWASPSSSKSTGRPSNSTSVSSGASADSTSEEDSAGESSEPS